MLANWRHRLANTLRKHKVQMYYRSGTGIHCCIGACRLTLRVHSPGGGTFLCEMTSWLLSGNYGVKSKIPLKTMHIYDIYLKYVPTKFASWSDLKRSSLTLFLKVVTPVSE